MVGLRLFLWWWSLCFVWFKNELLPSHLEDNPPTGKDNTSQVQDASRLVLAEYIYNIYIFNA